MPTRFETISGKAIGYPIGSGVQVEQLTSKETAVTLNKICGRIRTHNSQINGNARKTFRVNNSFMKVGDVVIVNHADGDTSHTYTCDVHDHSDGFFKISMHLAPGPNRAQHIDINFAIIKGVRS